MPGSTEAHKLLTAKDLAQLLSLSNRTVWKLSVTDRLPAPIRIGRSVRWSSREIARWVDAGCPPRSRWIALWRQMNEGSQ